MRSFTGFIGCLVLGALVACACPTAPTTALDKVQAWALAHAHEVCVLTPLTTEVNGLTRTVNVGVLYPVGAQPADAHIMPISYCNPAE